MEYFSAAIPTTAGVTARAQIEQIAALHHLGGLAQTNQILYISGLLNRMCCDAHWGRPIPLNGSRPYRYHGSKRDHELVNLNTMNNISKADPSKPCRYV